MNPKNPVKLLDLNMQDIFLGKSGRTSKLFNKKNTLEISTPKLYCQFGVNSYPNKYGGFANCHIDVSFNQNKNKNNDYLIIKELDKHIISLIKDNMDCFKFDEHIEPELVESMYRPIFKDNGKYSDKALKNDFIR